MKRLIILATIAVAAVAVAVPAYAVNTSPGQKDQSSTTLDACGYFIGLQTPNKTTTSGTTYVENGTWTGVSNNYDFGPVASLGAVKGSYTLSQDGSFSSGAITNGTEIFRSNAGTITQTYAYDEATGWHVSVTGTRSLSFLTSDTNGHCYSGSFPLS
jgi:ABC-type oligopeptide transport system substrate-binding subunit